MSYLRLISALCALSLPALLLAFSAHDLPGPRLLMVLVAPSAVNLSQASAIPIQARAVWASGRNFPDTVTFKTDLGHFGGTAEQELVVKKNGNVYPEVKLCFDNLAQAPLQPCHVSLIVDEQEVASHIITVRQATTVRVPDYPHWIPLGEKEQSWNMSWMVADQFGKSLAGVPGIVQYALPGVTSGSVAGVSDDQGRLQVALPPAVYEGECTIRLITATCASELLRIQSQRPDGFQYPNLVATFAVPSEIIYPIQEDIPVLVAVTSRDGRPLPEKIMVGANKHYVVPLQDGIGKVLISLRDAPIWGTLRIIAFIEEKDGDTVRQRIFGETSIPVKSWATAIQMQVEPLQQSTKDDPMCMLSVTLQDREKNPYSNLPVFITYPRIGIGQQYAIQETDARGIATFFIPPGMTPEINVISTGQSDFVILKQDDKGRITAWGHNNRQLGFIAKETITYDADGKPIVKVNDR